ncbi:MAG TPA: adenine phosphoribosyltransferase [Tepidisphaeraceae bacterium]|nr:adenine phosphoribosyltransferase [Tepidisphaeraceae bacterium]
MNDPIGYLKSMIRDIPDFPQPGIMFRDITPLLQSPRALALSIELMANPYRGRAVDMVIGAESRGFIFGTAVACAISAGFGIIRKPGKLPFQKISTTYELEYGKGTLEMHLDSIKPGDRVVVVDDVLATGGTMKACCDLVRECGGQIVGAAVLIELEGLKGRDKLGDIPVQSALVY